MSARVRADRLQTLFRQALPAIVISAVVAVMVAVALWDDIDRRVLTGWLELLVFLALMRLALVIAYARGSPETKSSPALEGWFVGSTIVVAAVWGVGGWLLMPTTSLAHQAMLYFFMMGLASGAVSTYGSEPGLVAVTITLIILPATLRLLTMESTPLQIMALGGVVYTLAAYRGSAVLSGSIDRSRQLSLELTIAHARAQELARTDELTGMNNRRAFLELAEQSFQQAIRYERPATLILLDVDRFKGINDQHGHRAGDDVLRALAEVVGGTIRASDVAGRMGGEEFAILLPETSGDDGAVMGERLRAGFAEMAVGPAGAKQLHFTASFGVAERDAADTSIDGMLARADAALYQAKRDGRNLVRVSGITETGRARGA